MADLIYVIHAEDEDGSGHSVIGVASTLFVADKMVEKYFGEFKILEFKDIRDSSLVWEKTLEVKFVGDVETYNARVWVESFTIDVVN